MNIGDDFRIAFTLYSGQFHRAVLKGNRELLALVNKGFNNITAQEMEMIESRWLGTELVPRHFSRYLGIGALVVALLRMQPPGPPVSWALAVVGSLLFLFQTGVLDALVWTHYFPLAP